MAEALARLKTLLDVTPVAQGSASPDAGDIVAMLASLPLGETALLLHVHEQAGGPGYPALSEAFIERLKQASCDQVWASLAAIVKSGEADEASETHTRWDHVTRLHRHGGAADFAKARDWTGDPDARLRRAGADVLAQLGFAERDAAGEFPFADASAAALDRLLDDPFPEVVSSALHALGFLRRGEIGRIARHASDPDPELRRAVVFALMHRTEPEARLLLIELSTDAEPDIRDWATFSLGLGDDIHAPHIRAALIARLDDPDEDTRAEAVAALERVAARPYATP